MPTSFEGLEYQRHLFKPLDKTDSGGCHADVYLPEANHSRPCPIAITIHGGGWATGDTHHIFMGHFKYLLDRGLAIVSLEYRLMPHARLAVQREDWLDGYRWTTETLPTLLDGTVDGTRAFVFGGSAGGTAVLYLGIDVRGAVVHPPRCLFSVYPAIRMDNPFKEPIQQLSYNKDLGRLIATLPEDQQELIRECIDGPASTGYSIKNEDERPLTGRRVFYDLLLNNHMLISCFLDGETPPYSKDKIWHNLVTSSFPPTLMMKAMGDELLDSEQTSEVYEVLQRLGVESKLVAAKDMKHADAEGENDMKEHPPREAYFWREVFNVALDWCIERTGGGP